MLVGETLMKANDPTPLFQELLRDLAPSAPHNAHANSYGLAIESGTEASVESKYSEIVPIPSFVKVSVLLRSGGILQSTCNTIGPCRFVGYRMQKLHWRLLEQGNNKQTTNNNKQQAIRFR